MRALPLLLIALLIAGSARAQALLHELVSPNAVQGGYFGGSVAGVPDVDGDGKGDLLVGAEGEDGNPNPPYDEVGRAYVFSGASGFLLHTLTSLSVWPEGNFGASVSAVPDVNGDAIVDLVVGARYEESEAGNAYVYSGATGSGLHVLPNPFDGRYACFGCAVAGIPDVDGDGRGDVLVGASGQQFNGGAAVFSGANGALLYEVPVPAGTAIFGWSVAGVPDVDGDGAGDFLIGAFDVSVGGRAYVFSGASGVLLHELSSPNEEEGGSFGHAVSRTPDLNGDGIGDLVVGAYNEDPATSPDGAGRAYVFDGATGGLLHTLASPNEEGDSFFGLSVSGVPDADGDGAGDLLVGAHEADVGGRAYVFSGGSGALLYGLVSPHGQPGGSFGRSVSGVPDADGDGRGDLLVGDYSATGEAGRAYLFSGDVTAPLFDAAPIAPPVEIPPEGGTFTFTVTLTSRNTESETWEVWAEGTALGGGEPAFAINPVSVPLAPGQDTTLVLTQEVAADVPPGEYTYTVYVGHSPTPAGAGVSFAVTKEDVPALLFDAAPVDPPIEIPPEGGSFAFTVTLTNQSILTDTWDVWAEGETTGPVGGAQAFALEPVSVTLEAGRDTTLVLVQEVAAEVPPGEYTYTVYAGHYSTPVAPGASFPVTKVDATGSEDEVPATLTLGSPRPNPSWGPVTIPYAAPTAGRVRLVVYDVLGREVALLVDGEHEAGRHEVVLDGASLPAGTYLVRMEAGGEVRTRRVTLVR